MSISQVRPAVWRQSTHEVSFLPIFFRSPEYRPCDTCTCILSSDIEEYQLSTTNRVMWWLQCKINAMVLNFTDIRESSPKSCLSSAWNIQNAKVDLKARNNELPSHRRVGVGVCNLPCQKPQRRRTARSLWAVWSTVNRHKQRKLTVEGEA